MTALLLGVTLLAVGCVVVIALAVTSGSVAAALVPLAFVIAAAAMINARVARLLDDSSDPEDVDVDAR